MVFKVRILWSQFEKNIKNFITLMNGSYSEMAKLVLKLKIQ